MHIKGWFLCQTHGLLGYMIEAMSWSYIVKIFLGSAVLFDSWHNYFRLFYIVPGSVETEKQKGYFQIISGDMYGLVLIELNWHKILKPFFIIYE